MRIDYSKVESESVLVSENYGCNLHQTSGAINEQGLADYVHTMSCTHGTSTVVVFRFPKDHPCLTVREG